MAFTGPPSSIETEVRTEAGLVVGGTAAWQIGDVVHGGGDRELHFRISFREIQE